MMTIMHSLELTPRVGLGNLLLDQDRSRAQAIVDGLFPGGHWTLLSGEDAVLHIPSYISIGWDSSGRVGLINCGSTSAYNLRMYGIDVFNTNGKKLLKRAARHGTIVEEFSDHGFSYWLIPSLVCFMDLDRQYDPSPTRWIRLPMFMNVTIYNRDYFTSLCQISGLDLDDLARKYGVSV